MGLEEYWNDGFVNVFLLLLSCFYRFLDAIVLFCFATTIVSCLVLTERCPLNWLGGDCHVSTLHVQVAVGIPTKCRAMLLSEHSCGR